MALAPRAASGPPDDAGGHEHLTTVMALLTVQFTEPGKQRVFFQPTTSATPGEPDLLVVRFRWPIAANALVELILHYGKQDTYWNWEYTGDLPSEVVHKRTNNMGDHSNVVVRHLPRAAP